MWYECSQKLRNSSDTTSPSQCVRNILTPLFKHRSNYERIYAVFSKRIQHIAPRIISRIFFKYWVKPEPNLNTLKCGVSTNGRTELNREPSCLPWTEPSKLQWHVWSLEKLLVNKQTSYLTDGLTDWLTDWLAGWLAGWLATWVINWINEEKRKSLQQAIN